MYFKNKPQGVPEILSNYFKNQKNQTIEFPEILSNYFKNKPQAIAEIPSNYLCTWKISNKRSSRLYQTTSKQTKGVPEIPSNYVLHKPATGVPRGYFKPSTSETRKSRHKPSPRFFQTMYFKNKPQWVPENVSNYFKNKLKESPRFLQTMYFKNQKNQTQESGLRDSFQVLQKPEKPDTRGFRYSFKLCTSKTSHRSSPMLFQAKYFKNQKIHTQDVTEILSNYFKNKPQGIGEIPSNYICTWKTSNKRSSKLYQTTSKQTKGVPEIPSNYVLQKP